MIDRADLYAAVQQHMRKLFPAVGNLAGLCLYWSFCLLFECHRRRLPMILQAGDMCWPRVPVDQLDTWPADEPTHVSFIWSPQTAASRQAVARGALPEIHVWVAQPVALEILDFSVGPTVRALSTSLGLAWHGLPPPDYLWVGAADLPAGVVYRPNRAATELALRHLTEHLIPTYLPRLRE